jgi:hypothetical protein
MTVTLELPPELEKRFVAQARERGIAVDEVVSELLIQQSPFASGCPGTNPAEIDFWLDAACDLVPQGTPSLSDEAFNRENLYTRVDDWR